MPFASRGRHRDFNIETVRTLQTTHDEGPEFRSPIRTLAPEQLYKRCDPDVFEFETTAQIEPRKLVIGQERAIEAVRFGIGIEREGYNLFVLGDSGAGRRALVSQHVGGAAKARPVPTDWCYVDQFSNSRMPRALELPAGRGKELQQDMEHLVRHLQTGVPVAFESEEYQMQQQAIREQAKESQEEDIRRIREKARGQGLDLLRTPMGYAFAPVKDGEVLSPDAVNELPREEQERLANIAEELQNELLKAMRGLPRQTRIVQDRIHQLNRAVARFAVNDLIGDMKSKYEAVPAVVSYLDEVEEDIVENIESFLKGASEAEGEQPVSMGPVDGASLRRYGVNVLVDNSELQHAPVVYEDNPTYPNLIGRIEYLAQMGTLVTDFNLIRPGALHRANGGYLVLDAGKVLRQPFAWETLKRVLHAREIRIEGPAESMGIVSTVTLEPEPIPVALKVVLVGDRSLYYLLDSVDPEFRELFKVMVDVDETLRRTESSQVEFAGLIASIVHREALRPVDRTGVARMVEQSARLAEDGERLSIHRQLITDLLHEADYWAAREEAAEIGAAHVERAILTQERRADRIRERVMDSIQRETVFISTEGSRVGQVNGLAVMQIGGFSFGKPNRISARVRLGNGRILDIERETELGGPLHSKGVLILNGFISGRYALEKPLSVAASLVFEQSYGMVDGDSASVAELVALLSALSDVPILQSLAVTGSVNQHGDVQPIGGANQKIEGFFDVCALRGLTGSQGVLVPASNVKHLMLREDVVESVKAGRFAVYPVRTIDEAVELLTGRVAGTRGEDGRYPEDSVNGLVEAKLEAFADRRISYVAGAGKDNGAP